MMAVEAAVVARKWRRVILLLRMMQVLPWVSRVNGAGLVASGLTSVAGRKLRSNSRRLSVENCVLLTQLLRHATAACLTTALTGTDWRSSRSVRQNAEPPLRRNDGSGVV